MAVFNNEQAQPLWVISSDLESGQLSIRAVNAQAEAVDKAFELWMLPGDDTAPRSFGLDAGSWCERGLHYRYGSERDVEVSKRFGCQR